jgi:hypothetical protein
VLSPEASNVVTPPGQIAALPEMVTVGDCNTVTVVVRYLGHGMPDCITSTVYTAEAVGVITSWLPLV